MKKIQKILILIPAYNEEKNLLYVIPKIPKNIAGIERDILVVDDGSSDRTSEIAENLGCRVVKHIKNSGVGKAFNTGVNYAIDNKYDLMVTMDADGQFDANEISKLVKPILKGKAQFVTGTRFSNRRRHKNHLKDIGNKFFTNITNRITGKRFTDTQCGFRAYSREALLRLNIMGDFTYTQEVFIDLAYKDIKMLEVPITVRNRINGKSRVANNVWSYGMRASKIIIRAFRDYKPLSFFGIPAITISFIGFLLMLFSLVYYLIYFRTTPVRMLIYLGAFLFIFGVILMMIALVADMFVRQRKMQEEILYRLRKK